MELIYAALLLHRSGKEINEENLKKVADAAGIKAEGAQFKALVAALDGVDIDKEIKEAAVMPVASSAGSGAKAEKKEETKETEKKSEEASAGLASLFG